MEFCILAVVGQEQTYGYRLLQRLQDLPPLGFTEGSVYRALGRLIDAGLVRVTTRCSSLGPPRRYLSLTADGRQRLTHMRTYWLRVGASIEALMGDAGASGRRGATETPAATRVVPTPRRRSP